MINELPLNKDQYENDDKSKKFDSLIRAYNEKGLFPFSLDNPSNNFNTNISSPFKNINNKQKFEFSSLKKEFSLNTFNTFSGHKLPDFIYGYPHLSLLESSGQKDYFDYQNNIKKEINMSGQKRIRQKLDKDFENIILSKKKDKEKEDNYKACNIIGKDKNTIIYTINDKFFDLLVNIYTKEGIDGIDIEGRKNKNLSGKLSFKQHIDNVNKNNIIEKNTNININIKNNNNDNFNEQISCICLKSKCLNNYCRCHKSGNICNNNCRCFGCKNNSQYIIKKENALNEIKETKIKNICNCRTSNCFLHYCNCKRRGIYCGKDCLCSNCKNNKKSMKIE